MEFDVLFKQLAEDYCNGRVDDLVFAVKQQINKLLEDKTTANALYELFGVENKNKALLIKKAIKVVESLCL